jgi:hypothetical protein
MTKPASRQKTIDDVLCPSCRIKFRRLMRETIKRIKAEQTEKAAQRANSRALRGAHLKEIGAAQ